MELKKILMVHNFYQVGGGEHTVYENEVSMLRDRGHQVIEYTRHNNELIDSKWKYIFLPITMIWSMKTFIEVRRIISEHNIDIVHCHNTFPLISPSVYFAARFSSIPIVQTVHNFRFLCAAGVFYRNGNVCEDCNLTQSFMPALKHKCYRDSFSQTLAVTSMLKFHRLIGTYKKINYIFLTEFNKYKFKDLIDIKGKNVFVKPNFVKYSVKSLQRQSKEKIFVFASRLDENKGIMFLLEQWKNMPNNYYLHIYGGGKLEELVKREVSKLANVKYFGFQSHEVIFDDLKNSTAMLFPTLLYEGFPMIIAESLAIGCPVVSSNIGNAADIVNSSKAGQCFSFDDENSLKVALDDVIINNQSYRENAVSYYREVLSLEKNYYFLNKIYENLVLFK